MKRSFFLMAGCCVGLSLLGTPLMAEALTGLHPNDHGFQIMAARLAAQLAPMLKLSTP